MSSKSDDAEDYSTTDFYTTAVLIAKRFQVERITTEGPGNKVKRFHFKDSPELRQVILSYMNRQQEGNLRDFRDAIETVKDMVHSG